MSTKYLILIIVILLIGATLAILNHHITGGICLGIGLAMAGYADRND